MSTLSGSRRLNGRDLDSTATFILGQTTNFTVDSATLDQSGGIFDLRGNSAINSNGAGNVVSSVTVQKTGSFTTSISVTDFTNTGDINVNVSELVLTTTGTHLETGVTATVADGTVLDVRATTLGTYNDFDVVLGGPTAIFEMGGGGVAGTQTYDAASSVTGPGDVIINAGGTLNYLGAPTFTGNLTKGGGSTATFAQTVNVADLTLSFGILHLDGAGNMAGTGTLSGSSTLTGLGDVTYSGLLAWTQGLMETTGSAKTFANGGITVSTNSGSRRLNGRDLDSTATFILGQTTNFTINSATLDQSGGIFDLRGNSSINSNGGGNVVSSVTVQKTGSFTTSISVTDFTNTGDINVNISELVLTTTGTHLETGVTATVANGTTLDVRSSTTGAYNDFDVVLVGAGSTFEMGGTTATQNYDAASSITGPGDVDITASGTLNFLGPTTFSGNLSHTGGGTTTFAQPLNVADLTLSFGILHLDGAGNMAGTGTMNGSGTLTGLGDVTYSGLLNWSQGTMETTGSAKTFANGGVSVSSFSGSRRLNGRDLDSTMTFTLGQTTNFTINGGATLDQSGGIFDLRGNSSINTNNTGNVVSSVTVQKTGSFTTSIATTTFTNTGDINVNTDTLFISPNFINTATATIAGGTTLTFAGATSSNAASGTIQGTGTLNVSGSAFTNNGAIGPGTSPGIMTINGDVTFANGSQLDIELAGAGMVAGTDYDQLVVMGTGNVTIDPLATLNLTTFGGYTGNVNDMFPDVIDATGAVNGQFDSVMQPATLIALPTYTIGPPGGLSLTVSAIGTINQWINPSNGAFDVGGNWSLGVPNAAHDTIIGIGAVTVTHGLVVADTVASLSLVGSSTFALTAGSLTINTDSILDGDLSISGVATLLGAGDVTVNGTFTANNANVTGTGTEKLITNGTSNINGPFGLNTRPWDNFGTANWTAGDITLALGASSILTNVAGGIFNINTVSANDEMDGAGSFVNDGTVNKNSNLSTSFNVSVANNAAFNVTTNEVRLQRNSTNTGTLTVDGTLTIDAGATLNLNAGTAVAGSGLIDVADIETLIVNVPVAMATGLTLTVDGTIANAQNLTIPNTFILNSGTVTGAGTFTTPATSTTTLSGLPKTLGAGLAWNSLGLVNWTAGDFVLTDAGSVFTVGAGAPSIFNINTGSSNDDMMGSGTIVNNGTLNKISGVNTVFNVAFTNTGTVDVQAGVLDYNFGNNQTAGITQLTGGSLDSAGNININGGLLQGSGNVLRPVIINAGGALGPGLSIGTMNVTGNVTFNSGGAFNVELAAGLASDILDVTGSVTINPGAILNLAGFGGYTGVISDNFTGVIATTGALNGTFTTINQDPGFNVAPSYTVGGPGDMSLLVSGFTNIWIGPLGGGLWSVPGNWSLIAVPLAAHDVLFNTAANVNQNIGGTINSINTIAGSTLTNTSGTLTINNDSMLAGSLTISGGTLTGAGDITVTGLTAWTNPSTISGAGMLIANGGLNLIQAENQTTWTLDRALELGGDSNWSPSSNNDSRILTGMGSITNKAVLTLAPNDPAFQGPGNRLQVDVPFTNDMLGTVTKSGGNVSADFKMPFDNAGLVNGDDAQALTLSGGGTHTGDFNITAGNLLQLAGVHTLSNTTSIKGDGTLDVLGVPGGLVTNGTVAPGASIGTLSVTGNVTFNTGGTLEVELGTALARDVLSVTGQVDINAGAVLNIIADPPYTGVQSDNFTGVITTTGMLNGTFTTINQDPNFSVSPSYTIGGPGDLSLLVSGFTNTWIGPLAGELWANPANWSLGAPIATHDVTVNTLATVTHDSGVDAINTLSLIAGALLDLTGGMLDIASASTIAGDINVNNATLGSAGVLTTQGTLTLQGIPTVNSPIDNEGTVLVPTGTTAALNGALTAATGSTIEIQSVFGMGNGTLDVANDFTNNGTIIFNNNGNAVTLNVLGGNQLINSTTGIIRAGIGGGTVSTLNAEVTNLGIVDVDSGLNITNTERMFDTTSGSVDVAATRRLIVTNGTTLFGAGTGLPGTGTLELAGAHVLDLALDFTNPAAGTVLDFSGAATIQGAGDFINQTNQVVQNETFNVNLNNQGTLTLPTGNLTTINGTLTTAPGSTIEIQSVFGMGNGTLDVANDFTNNGIIIFNNNGNATALNVLGFNQLTNSATGTIRAGIGGGTANTLNAKLTNLGTIDVDSGLSLTNTVRTMSMQSGTVDVAVGPFTVNGGIFDWQGGDLNGPGNINFIGGAGFTATGSGNRVLTNMTISPASLNLSGGSLDVAMGSTLDVSGATTLSGGSTLTVSAGSFNPNTLTLSDGTLTGAQNVIVPGLITWIDGTMSGTGTTFANGGIDIGAAFVGAVMDRDIEHMGTATWMPVANNTVNGTGQFTHQGGNLTVASRFFFNPDFVNNATLTINVPGDLAGFGQLDNTSTIQASAGTFRVDGGGTNDANISISGGATALFRSDYVFNDGGLFGGGTLEIDTGPECCGLTIDGLTSSTSFDPATIDVTSGQLNVNTTQTMTGSINVSSGALFQVLALGDLTLDATSVTGAGSVSNTNMLTLQDMTIGTDVANTGLLAFTGTNTISSTAAITGSGDVDFLAGTTDFAVGSGYNITGDTEIMGATVNFTSTSTGSLTMSGGVLNMSTLTSNFIVTGGTNLTGGTIQGIGKVETRGTTSITGPGSVTLNGTLTNMANTTWNFTNPILGTGQVDNRGNLTINNMQFSAGGYSQSAGSTQVNGTLDAIAVDIFGGTFGGNGAVDVSGGLVNNISGTVTAGASPGSLTIMGNFTQGSSGVMRIDLAGTDPGPPTEFDIIDIMGMAALDGQLVANPLSGFEPAQGTPFEFLKFTSVTGDFSNAANITSTSLQAFSGAQNLTNYVLFAGAQPPPPMAAPPSPPTPPDIQDANVIGDPGANPSGQSDPLPSSTDDPADEDGDGIPDDEDTDGDDGLLGLCSA